jgi:hypothetical protein
MQVFDARLAAVLAGLALAAPAAFAQAPPSSAPRSAPPAVQAPQRVPLSIARGIVKSVGDGRLVLDLGQPAPGQPPAPSAFVLDGQTEIRRLGRVLAPRDLRAGDAVTVGYQMRGDRAVASRVWLRFASAAPSGPARPAGAAPAR